MKLFKPKLTPVEIEYEGEKITFWLRPAAIGDVADQMRNPDGDNVRRAYRLVVNEDGSQPTDGEFEALMRQPTEVGSVLGAALRKAMDQASANAADAKKD